MKLKQISCLMCMSFSLMVVGCGNQDSSSTSSSSPSFTSPVSSTSPFDSSSTLSSSSSSSSSTTTGKTISQISDLILSTSVHLQNMMVVIQEIISHYHKHMILRHITAYIMVKTSL